MREYNYGRIRVISPSTIEEMLLAIGIKEDDDEIEILLSTDLIADICVRMVRIEDREKNYE